MQPNTYGLPEDVTAQSIFDTVAAHLIRQNRRSMKIMAQWIDGVSCAYRGDDGTACAVGCLISDDDYSLSMEGIGVSDLIDGDERVRSHMMFHLEEYVSLLSALQMVHDHDVLCDENGEFRPRSLAFALASVAHRFQLKFTHTVPGATP